MMTTSTTPTGSSDAAALPWHERWRRAFAALETVFRDPDRTDQVLVFSVHANAGTLHQRKERFFRDPRGQLLFAERRAIDSASVRLDELGALPPGTLGRAYADFLRARGLTPEVFDGPPEHVADPRAAYVVQRIRQTHDLWHVVTGYDTDPGSEVALQAFSYGQLGAPSSGILAIAGMLRGLGQSPALPRDVAEGYLTGRRARGLAVFPWEDHWATPLEQVRALLGIELTRRARRTVPRTPPASAPRPDPAHAVA